VNAHEEANKSNLKNLQLIQRDIERLRLQKSDPDVPEEYIRDSIAACEARTKPLQEKLLTAEKKKQQLIEETNPIFDKYVNGQSKPAAEESKDNPLNARDPEIIIKYNDLKQQHEKLKQEQAIKDLAAARTEQQLREQLRSVNELRRVEAAEAEAKINSLR